MAASACHDAQMKDYRHGSHTAFSIRLHIVWITKYRKKVLTGEITSLIMWVWCQECNKLPVDILKGYLAKHHLGIMVYILLR